MTDPRKARYYNNCVTWDEADVPALIDMIDSATDISYAVLSRHVNKTDLDLLIASLGYARTSEIRHDYHVSYHRSTLHGNPVYYLQHSAIEYVFMEGLTQSRAVPDAEQRGRDACAAVMQNFQSHKHGKTHEPT